MARLLVFWMRPSHLTEAEAEAWAGAELQRLLSRDGVERARLTRLRSASLRYVRPWDWLLELHLAAECDAQEFAESSAWREWMGDLRLLGMRPVAMVADGGRLVGIEEH